MKGAPLAAVRAAGAGACCCALVGAEPGWCHCVRPSCALQKYLQQQQQRQLDVTTLEGI